MPVYEVSLVAEAEVTVKATIHISARSRGEAMAKAQRLAHRSGADEEHEGVIAWAYSDLEIGDVVVEGAIVDPNSVPGGG